jgi:hypothetical protein
MPTAVFYQIDPPGRLPGVCWIASLYDYGDQPPFPLAVAWLTDLRGTDGSDPIGLGVSLDFILVPDHLRRAGHATALIQACEERWGGSLWLTDAISPEGEGLLANIPDNHPAPRGGGRS